MTARSFFRSRPWRVMRWAGLAMAMPALWACNNRSLEAPAIMPTRTFMNTFQETLNRKIDILFMVDNSSSMDKSQENLRANFPRFMDVLKALPDGLPDLHIAVVSSDMGTGNNDIPGCNASGGDNGIFHSGVAAAAMGCTATGLNANQTFISTTGGMNPQNNFSGDITQVFQCIAPIGAAGCGFEQQLRSMARSIGADGFPPPAENQGFLRPEAYLGIIFITNEDDCSAAQTSFYDVTDRRLSTPLGTEFRCNEFGHVCNGMPPSRLSPNGQTTDMVTYSPANGPDNCVSSETSGQLIPVAAFAQGVKSLKPDPAGQILVASIQGPTVPYTVTWKTPAVTTDGPWPVIAHSCTAADTSFADPGVRMQQFVQQFGGNGLVYSICEANFGPALNTIAMKLSQLIGPKCIVGTLWDKDPATPGVQPDCAVVDHVPNGSGTGTIDNTVPACDANGGAAPCYRLRAPAAMENCPANSNVVQIDRGGTQPPDNLRNSVSCSICIAGITDPDHGCP